MSVRIVRVGVFVGVCVMAVAGAVSADVILYDNGGPDGGNAYLSDTDPFNVYELTVEEADNFVLSPGASVVTGVHWWGAYWPNEELVVDDFVVTFYEDGGAEPGALVAQFDAGAVTRTDTGSQVQGLTLYAYDFSLASGLSLAADSQYFVSIANNTAESYEGWFWALNSAEGQTWGRSTAAEPWEEGSGELAFYLTGNGGVVPEPATFTLLGLGLLAGAVTRLRRKAH